MWMYPGRVYGPCGICRPVCRTLLLGLLLLLLTDADFEVLHFGFLETFVVM